MVILQKTPLLAVLIMGMALFACSKKKQPVVEETAHLPSVSAREPEEITLAWQDLLNLVLYQAELPVEIMQNFEAITENSPFMRELSAILSGDPYLRLLVDKQHALPTAYEPDDLVELSSNNVYRVSRQGLMLRKSAADALQVMAEAATLDKVTLVISSTYRSYHYQAQIYARNVREMGEAAADRESARPGHSQHQSGLVVDFGSIDDSFALTNAGKWMQAHASRFGWSLSFPDGYEAVTGYRWESWHYRYVGIDLCRFIDTYFAGIQQYALRFIYEWELLNAKIP
ncbi:MAG: M15 family metallopeptidase [Spirochaetaceae bacterium]|jgi:D-alanyl-D-alanine carboxypeptidase|nr:M15 family metallopeptidase [Spirochaetaceae bacterium]